MTLAPDQLTSPMSMASGGFATLWRAGAKGEYAIKCFNNGGMAAAEEEFETLLLLSGQSAVPQVYGLGTFFDGMEKGYAAIVEEYVDGFTLANALKRGLLTGSARVPVLDMGRTILIASELALALRQLERAGVSHRDLSANNVMLRRECVTQRLEHGVDLALIDFGQSTPVSRPSVTPSFKARLATVPYGAPEMYGGDHWNMRNSNKCDIWSFGAICVTMLVGEYWPEEISDLTTGLSSAEDLQRIARAKRKPLDLIALLKQVGKPVGDAERRLANVVRMCTNYDPDLRPTASELVLKLQSLSPGQTPRTPPRTQHDRVTMTTNAGVRKQAGPQTQDRTSSRGATVARPGSRSAQLVSRATMPADVRTVARKSEFFIEGTTLIRYAGSRTEVAIPDGVTSIGAHAFGGAFFVERVLLPKSVYAIGDYAFEGCSSLRGIAISSVERLGVGAFLDCTSLSSIVVREPVSIIPWYLFKGCTALEWVQLPTTIKSIGQEAFAGCTSLAQIDIPDSVQIIGDRAFFGCTSLRHAVIPASVTNIGVDAFQKAPRGASRGSVAVQDDGKRVRRRRILVASIVVVVVLAIAIVIFARLMTTGRQSSESASLQSQQFESAQKVTVLNGGLGIPKDGKGSHVRWGQERDGKGVGVPTFVSEALGA